MVVGEQDTARALGSGTVDVLGTPRLLALCEEACCRAIAASLPDGHHDGRDEGPPRPPAAVAGRRHRDRRGDAVARSRAAA